MPFFKKYEIKRPFAVRIGNTLFFDNSTTRRVEEVGYRCKCDFFGLKSLMYDIESEIKSTMYTASLDPGLYGHSETPGKGSTIIEIDPGEIVRLHVKHPDELVTPNNWVLKEKDYLTRLYQSGKLPQGVFLRTMYGNVRTSKLPEIIEKTMSDRKLIRPLGIVYRPIAEIVDDLIKFDPEYINFVIDSKDVDTVEVINFHAAGGI